MTLLSNIVFMIIISSTTL